MTPHDAPPLLIVSDVDGTLLDDRGQLPVPPATLRAELRALAARRGGAVHLALASSRTLRELVVLQRALGLHGPLIAEDGGVLALDIDTRFMQHFDVGSDRNVEFDDPFTITPFDASLLEQEGASRAQHGRRVLLCESLAPTALTLRARLAGGGDIHGALLDADASQADTQAQIGLGFRTRGARRRALEARTHSLLVDPEALDRETRERARDACAAIGLHCQRGGRWLTVTGGAGKGAALDRLRNLCTSRGVFSLAIAVGNEENDASLLAAANVRFVIDNPGRGHHPVLSGLAGAITLTVPGTGGWMEMLTRLSTLPLDAR
jgi:mannosyl-3-phosphoglycerate phosphatase